VLASSVICVANFYPDFSADCRPDCRSVRLADCRTIGSSDVEPHCCAIRGTIGCAQRIPEHLSDVRAHGQPDWGANAVTHKHTHVGPDRNTICRANSSTIVSADYSTADCSTVGAANSVSERGANVTTDCRTDCLPFGHADFGSIGDAHSGTNCYSHGDPHGSPVRATYSSSICAANKCTHRGAVGTTHGDSNRRTYSWTNCLAHRRPHSWPFKRPFCVTVCATHQRTDPRSDVRTHGQPDWCTNIYSDKYTDGYSNRQSLHVSVRRAHRVTDGDADCCPDDHAHTRPIGAPHPGTVGGPHCISHGGPDCRAHCITNGRAIKHADGGANRSAHQWAHFRFDAPFGAEQFKSGSSHQFLHCGAEWERAHQGSAADAGAKDSAGTKRRRCGSVWWRREPH
jgi:hypothetical protein